MRVLLIETVVLCGAFFGVCYLGTGTDRKNLRNYSSYPVKVQNRIQEIAEYRGKFKETGKAGIWVANFLVFTVLFLLMGIPIRQENFSHNFRCLLILGQTLTVFDLFIVDLLWWRNTKRIRLSKIPQKELYQDPKKHVEAFLGALVLYFFVALVDGYLLTLV
ncbi:ABC transporter permease [uncultured Varibaculum sp.]|uniref:ABC transporter permease n=1 Tax=uncultured Varibaculum sp. TaxID=413896 RepID=UPI0028895167|nr:ABC transporter permease [uncultured Varibaculum sp.]